LIVAEICQLVIKRDCVVPFNPFPNPNVAGNGGWVGASGGPLDGMPTSAAITIPPNGILLFARGR